MMIWYIVGLGSIMLSVYKLSVYMDQYHSSKSSRIIKYLAGPYVFLVLSHLVTINKFFAPWIMPDENIYLGHARFFAGLPHYLFQGIPYSSFGYSILITPIFWLTKNPETIYRLAIVFNAFLLSALYIIIFFILKKIFNKDDKTALILSLLVNFIPGIFLRANMVLVENIFIPVFYLSILLFFLLLQKINYSRAILFSFSIILLFATHYRALPIFLVAFLSLLYLFFFFRVKYSKALLLSVFLLIIGFYGTQQLNNYLMSIAWSNPVEYSIANLMPNGFLLKKIIFIFSALAGQMFYLIVASFGLVLYALLYVFSNFKVMCKERSIRKKIDIFKVYLFFACFSIFFSSVSIVGASTDFNSFKPDHFIYGRYNEVLLPLIFILGLEGLNNLLVSKKRLVIICIGLVFFLLMGAESFILHGLYGSNNIISFFYVRYFGPTISGISALFIVVIFFYIIDKIKKFYLKALFIVLLFILNIMCYYRIELFYYNKINNYQKIIIPILKSDGVRSIDFDLRPYKYFKDDPNISGKYWYRNYFLTQHYLPDIKVYSVYSLDQNQLKSDAVVTYCSWENSKYFLREKIFLNYALGYADGNCMALWLKNK